MGHLPGEVVRTTGQPSPPVFGIWAPGGEPRLPHVLPTELQVNAQRCRPRLLPQSPRLEAVALRMSSSRRQHERRHPTMTRDGYTMGLCLSPSAPCGLVTRYYKTLLRLSVVPRIRCKACVLLPVSAASLRPGPSPCSPHLGLPALFFLPRKMHSSGLDTCAPSSFAS